MVCLISEICNNNQIICWTCKCFHLKITIMNLVQYLFSHFFFYFFLLFFIAMSLNRLAALLLAARPLSLNKYISNIHGVENIMIKHYIWTYSTGAAATTCSSSSALLAPVFSQSSPPSVHLQIPGASSSSSTGNAWPDADQEEKDEPSFHLCLSSTLLPD